MRWNVFAQTPGPADGLLDKMDVKPDLNIPGIETGNQLINIMVTFGWMLAIAAIVVGGIMFLAGRGTGSVGLSRKAWTVFGSALAAGLVFGNVEFIARTLFNITLK